MGAYDAALKFLLTHIQDTAPHIVAQVAQGHLAALADEDALLEAHLDVPLDSQCSDPNCLICHHWAGFPEYTGLIPGDTPTVPLSDVPLPAAGDDPTYAVGTGLALDDKDVPRMFDPLVACETPTVAEGDGNAPA